MFGGKAFEDWIGEISLGKEVSKAFVSPGLSLRLRWKQTADRSTHGQAQADAEEEEAEASKVRGPAFARPRRRLTLTRLNLRHRPTRSPTPPSLPLNRP